MFASYKGRVEEIGPQAVTPFMDTKRYHMQEEKKTFPGVFQQTPNRLPTSYLQYIQLFLTSGWQWEGFPYQTPKNQDAS
jgi:hypothetical protein